VFSEIYVDASDFDNYPEKWWPDDVEEELKSCHACFGTGMDKYEDADCIVCFGDGVL